MPQTKASAPKIAPINQAPPTLTFETAAPVLTDAEGAADVREEEPEAPREVPLPEEMEPLWEPDADTDGVEIGAVGVLETTGMVADE